MKSCSGWLPRGTNTSGNPSPFPSAQAAPFVQWQLLPSGTEVVRPAGAVTSWNVGTTAGDGSTLKLSGSFAGAPFETASIRNEPSSLNHCAEVTVPPILAVPEGGISSTFWRK